jgi:hypothetical protein
MRRSDEVRYGATFTLSLLLSWTVATGLIVLVFWSGPQTLEDAATWAGLWVFTVATPTLQALRIHRSLIDLLRECPTSSPQTRRDLAHARFVVLMCGSMAVLLVCGLRLAR